MSRYVMSLNRAADKEKAVRYVQNAPAGTRLEFKRAKRSLPQNARLWAMLSEVAEQVAWHGVRLTADDFKLLFLDALKRELRVVPNIDGNGFVNLGRSSSELTKDEMSDLFTIIEGFAAKHGVVLSMPEGDA